MPLFKTSVELSKAIIYITYLLSPNNNCVYIYIYHTVYTRYAKWASSRDTALAVVQQADNPLTSTPTHTHIHTLALTHTPTYPHNYPHTHTHTHAHTHIHTRTRLNILIPLLSSSR